MKYKIIFSAVLILSILNTDQASTQSNWVLNSTGLNLKSVFFFDDLNGWIAGDSGTILATIDGGANWLCVESGVSKSLKSIFFINALTGWAAGNEGVILKSTDGGGNWSILSSGISTGIDAVYFYNADTGFVTGAFPTGVLKTTNGGTSWLGGIPNHGSGLYFSSSLIGLSTSATGYLSRTTNGGTAWYTAASPGNPVNQYSISFINPMTGWTVGTTNKNFKTTNGGANWITQTNTASTSATFYGIDFTDDLNGFIAGYSGYFSGDSAVAFSTTNGGTNWSAHSTGMKKTLRDIDFINSSTGWIVGDEGIILKTTNGGTAYSTQLIKYPSPFTQTNSLNSVYFKSEMIGWTTGLSGYVNKTTDGGNNWTTITSASYNWLYSICFARNNDTGWACGRNGTLQKTENGGVNWILLTTGTSQHLNCVVADHYLFPAAITGWCVGNNGTVFAVSGTGVADQSGFTTQNLNSVFIFDDYKAIVCGDAGTIFKTSDGGLNWSAQSSGTTENLKSIHFINGTTGYACGSSGAIIISSDGGSTWTSLSSGTTATLNSIAFEETMTDNGYAVGENGVIVATSNGGISWVSQSSGSSTPLYSLFVKEIPSMSGSIVTVIRAAGKFGKLLKKIPSTALPVELISFTSSVSNNNVTLYWRTAAEYDNKGFEIQRSINDGNWNVSGFISGNGNTNSIHNYTYNDYNLAPGKYKYRLKQSDYNGNFEYFNLNSNIEIGIPGKFALMQNFPNPFNPATTINYEINSNSNVSIKVFDISGREIISLVNENKNAGSYSIVFEGSNLSSGMYFYSLYADGKLMMTKKMMLIK